MARRLTGQPNGCPPKLTADVMRTICTAIVNGDSLEDACAMAGVRYETRRLWLRRGAEQRVHRVRIVEIRGRYTIQGPDGPEEHEGVVGWTSGRYRAFLDATERAEAAFRSMCFNQIRIAGADDWRALDRLLALRFPKQFGPASRLEVTGADGGPIATCETFDVRIADLLTPEQLTALEERIAKP